MNISQIPTPALLIERSVMKRNLTFMQELADAWHVALRPHTKTHKTPEIAHLQIAEGATGITVAKTGEAEVMAAAGIPDIFIANEIVGVDRLSRIYRLCAQGNRVSFGVDSLIALEQIAHVFSIDNPAHILIEVETERDAAVSVPKKFLQHSSSTSKIIPISCLKEYSVTKDTHIMHKPLQRHIPSSSKHRDRRSILPNWQREPALPCRRVSIGSTPSILSANLQHTPILEGITEIRPGTYVFMDAGQAAILGSYDRCAATVLATVTSRTD